MCQSRTNIGPETGVIRGHSAILGVCPGSQQEGPARLAERPPHGRRRKARGRCLLAHRVKLARCWLFGGVGFLMLPAMFEAKAFTVHFQDIYMVGKAIQNSTGEAVGPEDLRPFIEWQV